MRPIVHPQYDGRDLVLPDDPTAVLRMADCTPLAERLGDDIVTASGTTLLGADNKAGVAEIVTAAEYLMAHPEIPHGPIKIAFTPDALGYVSWQHGEKAGISQLVNGVSSPVAAEKTNAFEIGVKSASTSKLSRG